MIVTQGEMESPVGRLAWFVADGRVVALGFDTQAAALTARLRARFGAVELVAGRCEAVEGPLGRYLGGELGALAEVPIDPGGTDFERQVWAALRRIPAGATTSYGALAGALGRPSAVRAVGRANARNPISLVIPCHRVIGGDGDLRGYAGGLPRKQWLLAHEQR